MENSLDEIIRRARDAANDLGIAAWVKDNDEAAIKSLATRLTSAARSDMAYMLASAPTDEARSGVGFVYVVAALCQSANLLICSTLIDEVVRLAKERDAEDRISQQYSRMDIEKVTAEHRITKIQSQIDAILNVAGAFGQREDVVSEATHELAALNITL